MRFCAGNMVRSGEGEGEGAHGWWWVGTGEVKAVLAPPLHAGEDTLVVANDGSTTGLTARWTSQNGLELLLFLVVTEWAVPRQSPASFFVVLTE